MDITGDLFLKRRSDAEYALLLSIRKTSSMSTVSQATTSGLDLESGLDDVKEEEPYEEPDEDLCEKIVAQVNAHFIRLGQWPGFLKPYYPTGRVLLW